MLSWVVYASISDQPQWGDRDPAIRGQEGPRPGRLQAAQPQGQGGARRPQEEGPDLRGPGRRDLHMARVFLGWIRVVFFTVT